jgi:hypothetical protein
MFSFEIGAPIVTARYSGREVLPMPRAPQASRRFISFGRRAQIRRTVPRVSKTPSAGGRYLSPSRVTPCVAAGTQR